MRGIIRDSALALGRTQCRRRRPNLEARQVSDMRSVLVGLLGQHIQGSRSPYLHETEADAHGLRLIYRPFDTATGAFARADPARLIEAAELLGFAGLNVTHPYKQLAVGLASDVTADARQAGSTNTIVFRDGRRIAHNTDLHGFARALERNLDGVALEACLQVGAGGAGGATAIALLNRGTAHLRLYDADAAQAQRLAERLRLEFPAQRVEATRDLAAALETSDGVVNATPMGMTSHPGSAVPLATLKPTHWVADIVYFPLETALLRHAKSIGCRTMNGADMVVFQAAKAFELFTGLRADEDRMLASFASAESAS
jgi:quinate/shikimate dehydrogenase (NAD+)